MVSSGRAGAGPGEFTCNPTDRLWPAGMVPAQSAPSQLMKPPATEQRIPQAFATDVAAGTAQRIRQPARSVPDDTRSCATYPAFQALLSCQPTCRLPSGGVEEGVEAGAGVGPG